MNQKPEKTPVARLDSEPIVRRFAYADPPYVGLAARLYKKHKDYRGEVDHAALIARLESDFDGWALSASIKSLPYLMSIAPRDILTLAWIKPIAPPMGDRRHYSWEPVLLRPVANPELCEKMHLVLSPPQFTFRPKPDNHVIGEKPEEFMHWVLRCAGVTAHDEFYDLFPGSGACSRAWDTYRELLL
jgi:hypothetical protein